MSNGKGKAKEISEKRGFKLPLWFRVILSIGILGLLFRNLDARQVFESLKSVRIDMLLLACLIALLLRVLAAYRWYILLHGKNPLITLGGVVRLTFMSNLMGFFLPAGLGMEAVRIFGLTRSTSDLALSVSSALVDRFIALVALIVIVLVGIAVSPPVEMPGIIVNLAWGSLVFLGTAMIIGMSKLFRRLMDTVFKAIRFAAISTRLTKLYTSLDAYKDNPWLILWAIVVAICFQLMRASITLAVAWALGIQVPIVSLIVLALIIFFIRQIPISIGGLGIQEAGFIFLLGYIGVSPELALSTSLLQNLITYAVVMPPALWFYLRGGLSLQTQREKV